MASARAARRRLLVAEDDPDVARALLRWLGIDYDIVAVVSSGESLVEQAEALRPDGIVSDVGLEGLNGIAATTRIHALFPGLPILLVTAGDAAKLRPYAVAAGAVTLLHKSRLAELIDTLRGLWLVENDAKRHKRRHGHSRDSDVHGV
jgi:two-component system OmpR family response regulator